MTDICILGLGYIGLPTAAMFATHGYQVLGVDINTAVVAGLQRGEIHIYEPDLNELVTQALQSGNLQAASQPTAAQVFIIAVPTPFNPDKSADMRAVTSATEMIVPHLRAGNLVILESTSPPRTTVDLVRPILERSGLQAGRDFSLAYSPERVLPGQILHELVNNARVIGGIDRRSAEKGRDVYAAFVRGEIFLTDATTAEMVKLMENTYRDVNIAIANEFSRLAERFGCDVWEAISLANRHPRVKILNPGVGVGGHCIGVDPWFLVQAAPDLTPLIRTARTVNDGQPHVALELIRRQLGGLTGKRIALLGLAYKPNIDDLRESPAVELAGLLAAAGAQVTAFEPFKPDARFAAFPTVPSLQDALQDAEALVLAVNHQQFCQLQPQALSGQMPGRLAIDLVHGWELGDWRAAGFRTARLGSALPGGSA